MKIGQVDNTAMNENANNIKIDDAPLPDILETLVSSGDGVSVNNCAFSHHTPDLLTKAYFDERIGLLEKSIPTVTQIVDLERSTALYKMLIALFEDVREKYSVGNKTTPADQVTSIWRNIEPTLTKMSSELTYSTVLDVTYLAEVRRYFTQHNFEVRINPEGVDTILGVRDTGDTLNILLAVRSRLVMCIHEGVAYEKTDTEIDPEFEDSVFTLIEVSIPTNRVYKGRTSLEQYVSSRPCRVNDLALLQMTRKDYIPGTVLDYFVQHNANGDSLEFYNHSFQPYKSPRRISEIGNQGYERVLNHKAIEEMFNDAVESQTWSLEIKHERHMCYYAPNGEKDSVIFFRLVGDIVRVDVIRIGDAGQHELFVSTLKHMIAGLRDRRMAQLSQEFDTSLREVTEFVRVYYKGRRPWWRKLLGLDPKIVNSQHWALYHRED